RKLCTEPTVGRGPYRFSRYVLRTPCEEGVLLYHTLTGELLLLSEDEERGAGTDGSLRTELIKRRFLVPEDYDEYVLSRQIRQVAGLLAPKKKTVTTFTVFTTTDCNARCPYCYELGRPRTPMSDRTAADAAEYIARVSGGEKVKFSWFGGEPLLNSRAIDVITSELRRRGVSFTSKIVSNGYLFDAGLIRKAKSNWALENVQITLDGTEENYNRIKGFVDSEGSAYERVLSNIGLLLGAGIRVAIRMNADLSNMGDLTKLTDELIDRFGGEKKLTLYSVLLRDFTPAGTRPETEADAIAAWDALQRKILASPIGGVRGLPRSIRTNGCMADNDGAVTILPDGRLGKCEHESEQLLIGSIYDGVTDAETVSRWRERVEVPECRTCAFAPVCIRLRLCSWTNDRCDAGDRERMRKSVEQMMLNEYARFKKSGGNIETDENGENADFSGFGR
ncbi:MAG: 4Fe-4S cluster-binding domain-containing protein, partial [Clostridia bacterium]|nr:4Fe-4S cluster-binding domain-containing protein [Clostridia bacterium]